MRILMAASEMTPFAKTGGLGDVVSALSAELARRGHDVMCCLPYYRSVREALPKAKPVGLPLALPVGDEILTGDVLEVRLSERHRLLLIRRDEFFDRSELYHAGENDFEDNAERFLFFSKAVAELVAHSGFKPDVVHCHDWQSAFVPVATTYRRQTQPFEAKGWARTVFTIHNIAYQGLFPSTDFPLTNLPGEFFMPPALEFYGRMNLMKGGIVFADAVTTVSKRYAQEIQTPEGGFGLDPVLRSRRRDVVGILNGADYRTWNPAADPVLKAHYDADDLSGKRACRRDLVDTFGVEAGEKQPIAAVISRLTDLKGVDLLADAAEDLVKMGLVLVVLGKGAGRYEKLFAGMAKRWPKKVGVRIAQDETLAHKTQAGADLLLMPSKFEPCGLTQMYALKYGTIPVVHATGGLDDTIRPYSRVSGQGNGFKFAAYTADALVAAVRGALGIYKEPKQWQRLMRNAMACDFSWQRGAQEYEKLYAAL